MSAPMAILAIADTAFRERVGRTLRSLRWQVQEAAGGAEALAQLASGAPVAVIIDTWLPDLEIAEFVREVEASFPDVEMISTDGSFEKSAKSRTGRRGELLYALRVSQEWDGAVFNSPGHASPGHASPDHAPADQAPAYKYAAASPGERSMQEGPEPQTEAGPPPSGPKNAASDIAASDMASDATGHKVCLQDVADTGRTKVANPPAIEGLAEFHGSHPRLLEVYRRIRLVGPRPTPVLVLGPSGSGKELVARALHRLSPRSARPLVTLNCAAIPESLLEAELFGHTKGAFTGAVQGRSGRIEAAHGGTLFLDEIGEMPLPLQAKLLRFLEAGELQKVGDNDIIKVDVRVIAASHQPLAQRASQGLFRMDLYFRLAVFLIETPALETHREDIPGLAQLFLRRLTEHSPAKVLSSDAIERLHRHGWPGNVRELSHVIERAYILAEERREITPAEIEFASFS